jgi:hypothetical protein
MIIKREVIMEKHAYQQSPNFVYFEAQADDEERTDGYYMTLDRWDDMNRPETITVTVVPGDTLTPDGNGGIIEYTHRSAENEESTRKEWQKEYDETGETGENFEAERRLFICTELLKDANRGPMGPPGVSGPMGATGV